MKQKYPYKLIDYKLLLSAIPYMGKLNVSEISRGMKASKQTSKGFAQNWIDLKGNKAVLHTLNGYKDQTWGTRRTSFIKRHLAQIKKNNEPLFVNGQPTRRHLSLIAWGYTPNQTRLRAWAKTQASPYMKVYKMFIA